MATDIVIPEVGESISEVVISQWLKADGEYVEKDEPIVELETDKINQEVVAPEAGILRVKAQEGDTLEIGAIAGAIEEGDAASAKPSKKEEEDSEPEQEQEQEQEEESASEEHVLATSVAKKIAQEHHVDLNSVEGTGANGRITKDDVLSYVQKSEKEESPSPGKNQQSAPAPAPAPEPERVSHKEGQSNREVTRERMSTIRKRIASRLVEAQQTAAMLTTFNEADMSAVMALRNQYKESFQQKHGVKLGFMSFFIKAAVEALKSFPRVNAYIEDNEFVYHHYYDIAVAVGTDRGLVVPVIRNAEQLNFAELENTILDFAKRAQDNKLSIEELTGGTFTISNGGVYGSMLSTPILNPPQSGILGMHNIMQRPMAVNGQMEIRPMMYLALSYDHRIVDGKEAVGFLVKIKECIESPERMLLEV